MDKSTTLSHAPITLRPHHIMCTIGFKGKGYSAAFVENYKQIKEALEKEPLATIQIHTDSSDHICSACPNQISLPAKAKKHVFQTRCSKEAFISLLDKRHAHALSLSEGETSWKACLEKAKKVTPEQLKKLCRGCMWLNFGICEQSLRALRENT